MGSGLRALGPTRVLGPSPNLRPLQPSRRNAARQRPGTSRHRQGPPLRALGIAQTQNAAEEAGKSRSRLSALARGVPLFLEVEAHPATLCGGSGRRERAGKRAVGRSAGDLAPPSPRPLWLLAKAGAEGRGTRFPSVGRPEAGQRLLLPPRLPRLSLLPRALWPQPRSRCSQGAESPWSSVREWLSVHPGAAARPAPCHQSPCSPPRQPPSPPGGFSGALPSPALSSPAPRSPPRV